MRYAVISKGLSLDQVERECLNRGASNVRKARALGQVFCEMSPEAANALSQLPGLTVKGLKRVKADQVAVAPRIPADYGAQAEAVPLSDLFNTLREAMAPPLTGAGFTVAVLDSGIRKTHELLRDKVVYEKNFTDSDTCSDVYGHGTGVAGLIAGGSHGDPHAGMAPGALLMNIKVLGDEGEGSEEDVVMGIEEVVELVEQAQSEQLWITEPMYPNAINMSFGGEDDGDPDNPVRVACREVASKFGLGVAAAAGNDGPQPTTITSPACDPQVVAVGAIVQPALGAGQPFEIWEKSSRGPTEEGATKPDFVFWGVNIEIASHEADDRYQVKSGTSFACPAAVGATGALWEAARRILGESYWLGWDQLEQLAPQICGKPQDAPAVKGNTYGYGLPLPEILIGLMQQRVSPMSGMTEIMAVGVMAMMIGAMF